MSAIHTLKSRINPSAIITLAACLMLLTSTTVFAHPYLQLDASSGIYIGGDEESISPTTNKFTLYALIEGSKMDSFNDIYYVSAAVTPQVHSHVDLGSFAFAGDYQETRHYSCFRN